MTKTSTIQFTINNLASKAAGEVSDIDQILDPESEFSDVVSFLDKLNLNVDQIVVDKILAIANSME